MEEEEEDASAQLEGFTPRMTWLALAGRKAGREGEGMRG